MPGGSTPRTVVAADVAGVVAVRNRDVRTRTRNHSEHHSVPAVVVVSATFAVVSVVVSAVFFVSYNVSQVFAVHYKINKQNQVSILVSHQGSHQAKITLQSLDFYPTEDIFGRLSLAYTGGGTGYKRRVYSHLRFIMVLRLRLLLPLLPTTN